MLRTWDEVDLEVLYLEADNSGVYSARIMTASEFPTPEVGVDEDLLRMTQHYLVDCCRHRWMHRLVGNVVGDFVKLLGACECPDHLPPLVRGSEDLAADLTGGDPIPLTDQLFDPALAAHRFGGGRDDIETVGRRRRCVATLAMAARIYAADRSPAWP